MFNRRALLLLMMLGLGGIALIPRLSATDVVPTPNPLRLDQGTPMTQPTFPLDGKPVYVLHNGQWREARLMEWSWRSDRGERYKVLYEADNRTEEGVGRDRIRSLSQAQQAGMTTKAYDLSTPAGINQIVEAHNQWRAKVGVPPLRWSSDLATYAQQWAEKLLAEDKFEHRRNSPYGENLAFASGQQLSPDRVVEMWGDEVKDYNYRTNQCTPGQMCGHYTQIVWRSTAEVGCGMARGKGKEIWVCNYNPPGNIVGQKPY